jgi:hypothetical protein
MLTDADVWQATGSASVTVVGASFGAAVTRSQRARVGGSASENTFWLSDTSVKALAATGVLEY